MGGCIGYPYHRIHGPGFGSHWGCIRPSAYLYHLLGCLGNHLPGYLGYPSSGYSPLVPGWNDLNHLRHWGCYQNRGCFWRACCCYTSSRVSNPWGGTERDLRIRGVRDFIAIQ